MILEARTFEFMRQVPTEIPVAAKDVGLQRHST